MYCKVLKQIILK